MKKVIAAMAALISLTLAALGQGFSRQAEFETAVLENLNSQPVCFRQNQGQWDNQILFRTEIRGVGFYFGKDNASYLFTRNSANNKESILITAKFIGINPDLQISGENQLPYNSNYFYGNNQADWRTDVPNYASIIYRDIWPGIDLRYHGDNIRMKYDFIISPGTAISQIKIQYDGIDNLTVSANGDLRVYTEFGSISEHIPAIYQEIEGKRVPAQGGYTLISQGIFGFKVERYNPAYPLYIDPELVYSTYIGGSLTDIGRAVATDSAGNIYVAGGTSSSNFPSVNPIGNGYYNAKDVFVTKVSNSGGTLLYSTFLGGIADEDGYAISVDNQGYAYVTGSTGSTNFPIVNGYDSTIGGSGDAFAAKISPSGNTLIYSTFLGGANSDFGRGIAVNSSGNAVVTGFTLSSDFPVAGGFDITFNGSGDAYITKISSGGDALVFSAFLGGTGADYGFGVGLDGSGNIYVTGTTSSADLPCVNALQDTFAGMFDAIVAKVDPSGSAIQYCTYFGGANTDQGLAIAVSNGGDAYITGFTGSTDFPLANAAFPSYNPDYYSAYVAKITNDSIPLSYSTYLGGYYEDQGFGIDVDDFGCAYVVGYTNATDFPMANAYDSSANGEADVFLTKFEPSGYTVRYSTYLGGTGADNGYGVVVDNMGYATVVGYTSSGNFPKYSAYDSTINGGSDVFATRFAPVSGLDDNFIVGPTNYQLLQNYPNPFNNQTIISCQTPIAGNIKLEIFDILGRRVSTLVDEVMAAGKYEIIWNANGLSSGIYFSVLSTDGHSEIKRMVLLK